MLVPVTVTPLRPDPDQVRRDELASFLRSRRERLRPEDVGLTPYGRRRTPGLRREEVAQLAGVGVTWYTWLEQGRDINVSTQVLEALARTLHFDRHEHAHLMALAGAPDATPLKQCPTVTPGVLTLLGQLDPSPAVVMNARRDLLAHNDAYLRIFPELLEVPAADRNLLWLLFTHPAWRRRLPAVSVGPQVVDLRDGVPAQAGRL
jgi:transcriptional regulator with XRE-family HTH domain